MILDPSGQFIKNMTEHCEIQGKMIREVGCGAGRIMRDLAVYAAKVVAVDPAKAALQKARFAIDAENVEFIKCTGETLDLPESSFDIAGYSLSLHHIPVGSMHASFVRAACLMMTGR